MSALDLSQLATLSSESLNMLKKEVSLILRKRSCKIGSVSWFMDKSGNKRFIRITGVNPKTVSGIEVDWVTHAPKTGKWRVSHDCLTSVSDGITSTATPSFHEVEVPDIESTAPSAHTITTAVDDAW